jgi:hypothetical protein
MKPLYRQPVLRGELVEVRPLRADDFDALFAVADRSGAASQADPLRGTEAAGLGPPVARGVTAEPALDCRR